MRDKIKFNILNSDVTWEVGSDHYKNETNVVEYVYLYKIYTPEELSEDTLEFKLMSNILEVKGYNVHIEHDDKGNIGVYLKQIDILKLKLIIK